MAWPAQPTSSAPTAGVAHGGTGSPAKIALEHLYNTGTLTIANPRQLQRIYGITENVLPDWVDTTPPSEEEAYLTPTRQVRPRPRHLLPNADSRLLPHEAHPREAANPAHARRGNIADGQHRAARRHSRRASHPPRQPPPSQRRSRWRHHPKSHNLPLSIRQPFLGKGTRHPFWGFQQILEAYKPAPQRIWGYFCLPILRNDQTRRTLRPQASNAANPPSTSSISTSNRASSPKTNSSPTSPPQCAASWHSRRHRPSHRAQQTTRLRRKLLAAM